MTMALAALILNLIVPNTKIVKAEQSAAPSLGHSHAVLLQANEPSESTALPQLPTVPDKPAKVKRALTVRASAYTSSRAETDSDPLTTASGSKVRDGIIAANGLPFGTKVRIPSHYGDKIFTVQDRMNAKWGNRKIDIWMTHRADALQWGVRTVTIEIIS
jgi:3D (Asp-Asp-Asp) domain-containing protein